jgi:murein L,D-transpeptidase YafK
VKKYFSVRNISYQNFNLFLRVFKQEGVLEVWVKEKGKANYTLLASYEICASSGVPGPKRKEGDAQVPEGVYAINHFNPLSNYHLSLGINYPNSSDQKLSDPKHPGGSIYIHGNCVTIGCMPISDDKIKELYIIAVEAKDSGQEKIPVHIFPCRMEGETLNRLINEYPKYTQFWTNLQTVFSDFEKTKHLKEVSVDSKGLYRLK